MPASPADEIYTHGTGSSIHRRKNKKEGRRQNVVNRQHEEPKSGQQSGREPHCCANEDFAGDSSDAQRWLLRRVLFARAADLVRQLLEARDARELGRLQRRLLTQDVLIIDELGFVPFDRVGGELLFNLLADRYERRATVVTTNLAFAEWVTVFGGDEKLTTALLDRLAHHATVITTKGKSYRMKKRRTSAA